MIGRIDRHGRIELPGGFAAPARRKRGFGPVYAAVVWGLAILLALMLTASVTLSLLQALERPAVPAQELVIGQGPGTAR